jgi:hypothetical protein
MCILFWDRKGVLLVEFLPQDSTINARVYCDTLKKLRRSIQNKRRGMLSWGVVMPRDNARPHTATTTQDLVETFGWEQFHHPPTAQTSSDFHVSLHLKTFLGGRRFHDDKEAVNTCLASQAASFYDAGIQKLVPRYTKCLNNGGNWCPATPSASTMVETMSKSSVQYVHQMAIQMVWKKFLALFNNPSELTSWITFVYFHNLGV